jgi:hypothetical protein
MRPRGEMGMGTGVDGTPKFKQDFYEHQALEGEEGEE